MTKLPRLRPQYLQRTIVEFTKGGCEGQYQLKMRQETAYRTLDCLRKAVRQKFQDEMYAGLTPDHVARYAERSERDTAKEGKSLLTIAVGYQTQQTRHAAPSSGCATSFPQSHTWLLLACRTVREGTVSR